MKNITNRVVGNLTRSLTADITKSVTDLGASGGSAFDPSQLDGLELWLDAADTDTVLHATDPVIASDGETVRQWLDKSGNDRHANQTTGTSQPLLDVDGIGGKPALVFDGDNDVMTAGSVGDWNFMHDGSDGLAVVVARFGANDNPGETYTILGTGGVVISAVGFAMLFRDLNVNNAVLALVTNGSGSTRAVNLLEENTLPANQDVIYEMLIDADNATAANRAVSVVNGSAVPPGNTDTAAPSTANSSQSLHIGGPTAGVTFAVASLAEVILCSNANTSNRGALRSYLASKWGVALA
jgi:hypothetical protein